MKRTLKTFDEQGGNIIWGNLTHAADDEDDATHSHGELVAFRHEQSLMAENRGEITPNLTAEGTGDWILRHTPSAFQVRIFPIGCLTLKTETTYCRKWLQRTIHLVSSETRMLLQEMMQTPRNGLIRWRLGTLCHGFRCQTHYISAESIVSDCPTRPQ